MNGLPTDRRRIVIGAAAVVGLAGLLFGGWAWWQSKRENPAMKLMEDEMEKTEAEASHS
jgi:hypothetical protein